MGTGSPSPPTPPLLHIPYFYIMVVTASMPIVALLLSVTLGVYLHFDETTSTHCKVPNFVPSISSVVGGVTPERYIWRICIAIFSFPRLFDSLLCFNLLSRGIGENDHFRYWGNYLLFVLHFVHYFSLFGLSFVSSTENFTVHRNCFIGFIVSSMLYMVLFLPLFKMARQPPTYRDKISFRLRLGFAIAHFCIFFLSLYLYWRHNTFCEPYMYSWYSLCEYLVVLTNIAFHTTLVLEFQGNYISVAPPSRLKTS